MASSSSSISSSSSSSSAYCSAVDKKPEHRTNLGMPSLLNPNGMVRTLGYTIPKSSKDADDLAVSPFNSLASFEREPQFTVIDLSRHPLKSTVEKVLSSSPLSSLIDSPVRRVCSEEKTEDLRKFLEDKESVDDIQRQFSLPEFNKEIETIFPSSSSSQIFQELYSKENKELETEEKLSKAYEIAQLEMNRESPGRFFYNKEKPLLEASTTHFLWKGQGFNIPFDLEVAICSQMGTRSGKKRMEDRDLAIAFNLKLQNGEEHTIPLCAVFDGHGGTTEAVDFVKSNLPDEIQKALIEYNPQGFSESGISEALTEAFRRTNQKFQGEGGTTAVVSLIINQRIWTASAGDSRASLSLNNGEPVQLSIDAKVEFNKEKLIKRGGTISLDNNYLIEPTGHKLQLAKTFGDRIFQPIVTEEPDIISFPLSGISTGNSLMLASDGIYDVASTRQVAQEVFRHRKRSAKTISNIVLSTARYARTRDDLTFLFIRFFKKKPEKKEPALS